MTADTLILNADIRTMDGTRPRAQALAIAGGRVLALGSDAAMRDLAGPGTRIIDAGGRVVLPGLQDAHVHLLSGGIDLATTVLLRDAADVGSVQARLAAQAARHPGLAMVTGTGWPAALLASGRLDAAALDAAVPDRPAMVCDDSYHNACLNSAALALAGIGDDTPDPPNGHIQRDAAGRATGILHEDAVPFFADRLPQRSEDERFAGLMAGMAHANAQGITGIIDPKVTEEERRIYARGAAEGRLTLDVGGAALVSPGDGLAGTVERLTAWRAAHPGPDFHIHSAKFFLDGVFENRTAACLAPYADAPGGNAPVMFEAGHLAALVRALDAARFQCHFHVIGDAAARAALDAVAAARAANGPWPALHQLAHLQLTDAADIPRLAALEAMANIQPLWARFDPAVPDIALDMIGPARLPLTYAFRRMLDAGAAYCLSSDWPVSTLNPFEIIETAVTRQPRAAEGHRPPFLPAERLTVQEALLGYTVHAAAACWRGMRSGRLLPGFQADLIVLDRDPLAVPAAEIGETRVLLTLHRGREVHRADFDG